MGLLVALPASAAPSGAADGTIVLSNGTSGTGVASKGEFYSDQTLCGDGTTTCNVAKVTVTDTDLSVTSTGTARIVTTGNTGNSNPFVLTGGAGRYRWDACRRRFADRPGTEWLFGVVRVDGADGGLLDQRP